MALVYNSLRDGGSGASASSFGGAVRLFLSERLRSAFRLDISIGDSGRCSGGSQPIDACADT